MKLFSTQTNTDTHRHTNTHKHYPTHINGHLLNIAVKIHPVDGPIASAFFILKAENEQSQRVIWLVSCVLVTRRLPVKSTRPMNGSSVTRQERSGRTEHSRNPQFLAAVRLTSVTIPFGVEGFQWNHIEWIKSLVEVRLYQFSGWHTFSKYFIWRWATQAIIFCGTHSLLPLPFVLKLLKLVLISFCVLFSTTWYVKRVLEETDAELVPQTCVVDLRPGYK